MLPASFIPTCVYSVHLPYDQSLYKVSNQYSLKYFFRVYLLCIAYQYVLNNNTLLDMSAICKNRARTGRIVGMVSAS